MKNYECFYLKNLAEDAWKALQQCKSVFGDNNIYTKVARARWGAYDKICVEFNIDYSIK